MNSIKNILLIMVTVVSSISFGGSAGPSLVEKQKLIERIKRIYSQEQAPDILNERPVKVLSETGEPVDLNIQLKQEGTTFPFGSFEDLAQKKLATKFLKAQCRWLKKHLTGLNCESDTLGRTWESIEPKDRLEKLTRSWLPEVETLISKLPVQGQSELELWSDDYWRIKWGGTSYRYAEGNYFDAYEEAIASYSQPQSWLTAVTSLELPQLTQELKNWSPSEKYDLSVNDMEFNLTREQKNEGKIYLDEDGEVENWMGLCHGWAAAAIMAPKPMSSVVLWGPKSTQIRWFPHDIRAMTTLSWANGSFVSQFLGSRCNVKKPETYPNGRIKDSECFDNNPAAFHLALANLVGRAKASFIMDAAYDYQVWNQPVKAYKFTYFNPLNPDEQSSQWSEVAIPYDARFKAKDRFQNPLTRGKRISETSTYDDSEISKVVGVIVTVEYLGEVTPVHGDRVRTENFIRVSYSYDLELIQTQRGYVVSGGEWHSNAHPDFLWVPEKGAIASTSFDYSGIDYVGIGMPSGFLTETAKSASQRGYPLCPVLSKLISQSSGKFYGCLSPNKLKR